MSQTKSQNNPDLSVSNQETDHLSISKRENLILRIGYTEHRNAEKPNRATRSLQTGKSRTESLNHRDKGRGVPRALEPRGAQGSWPHGDLSWWEMESRGLGWTQRASPCSLPSLCPRPAPPCGQTQTEGRCTRGWEMQPAKGRRPCSNRWAGKG